VACDLKVSWKNRPLSAHAESVEQSPPSDAASLKYLTLDPSSWFNSSTLLSCTGE